MPVCAEFKPTVLRVAIVASGDDARCIRDLVVDTGTAISVTVCENMPSAFAHLDSAPCDVIVLDLADAGILDAIERLREHAADTALLVLTQGNDEVLREQALARGAQDSLAMRELRPDLLGHALRHAVSQVRLECAMQARQTQMHSLFDLNPNPMWVFDAETLGFVAVNQAAIHSYGFSEQEFLSMSIADIRSPAEADRLSEHVDAGLAPLNTTGIWRHRRKDGSEIEVEVTARAVPYWGRNARLVQAREVTAERRAMRALEASERRFRDFFEHSAGLICIHELDGTLLSVNPAAADALGRSLAELLGTPLRNLSLPELRFLVDNYLERIACNGEDTGYMSVLDRNGAELVWQYRNRVYIDADGSSLVMGYAQDITSMRMVERALQRSERRLKTIADTLPLKIAYLDAQQRIVFANESWRHYFNAPQGEKITGGHVRDVIGAERYARRQPFLARALGGERVVFETEEGEGADYRCVEITFIPEFSENRSDVIGVHAMMQDVTVKKREEVRLTSLARVDDLTGLQNRAGFYERLENAITRSRDQDSLLALFYLDIDRFKQVNDTHGHAIGDALIRAFAARLGDKVRASDVVARLGGDEFALVMEGLSDIEHVHTIATELVAAMGRPFELRDEGLTLSVGASIGIAVARAIPLSAAQFVERADALLYEAKQVGRGTYRLATIAIADADANVERNRV